MKPNKYCHFCGTEHTSTTDPYECKNCNQTTWVNPVPVIIVAIPLEKRFGSGEPINAGYLGIIRGDKAEPGYNKLAFVSGFLDKGESWEEASIRETKEESGLDITGLKLVKVSTVNNMLFFLVTCEPIDFGAVTWSFNNNEVAGLVNLTKDNELAFPIQQEFLNSLYI